MYTRTGRYRTETVDLFEVSSSPIWTMFDFSSFKGIFTVVKDDNPAVYRLIKCLRNNINRPYSLKNSEVNHILSQSRFCVRLAIT